MNHGTKGKVGSVPGRVGYGLYIEEGKSNEEPVKALGS